MAVSPAKTQVEPEVRRLYEQAVRHGLVKPAKEFRMVYLTNPKDPTQREYFPADDDGQPLVKAGGVKITATIGD